MSATATVKINNLLDLLDLSDLLESGRTGAMAGEARAAISPESIA